MVSYMLMALLTIHWCVKQTIFDVIGWAQIADWPLT